jgi:hypothetical protein
VKDYAKAVLCQFDEDYVRDNGPDFVAAVGRQAEYSASVWGFVDGTHKYISMPSTLPYRKRKQLFGRKNVPTLNYQVIIVPNGLAFHVFGPVSGHHHDSYVFLKSLVGINCEHLNTDLGYNLYGDRGYARGVGLMRSPKKGEKKRLRELSGNDALLMFHKAMKTNRASIEHWFAQTENNFEYLSTDRKMLTRTGCAEMFVCVALLTNFLTCREGGNQVSGKFQLRPPSWQAYLNHVRLRKAVWDLL